MSTIKLAEQFVETYNAPGSDVYPLYASEVDWKEQPTGRKGGREELFAALKEIRAVWAVSLVVQSIQEVGEVVLLNTALSGTPLPESGAEPLRASVLWALRFNADGLIDLEYDYAYAPGEV